MSETPAIAKPQPQPWTRWLDRGVWVLLAGFVLYRCVLPVPAGPPPADVRVATSGKAVLIAFDGSR